MSTGPVDICGVKRSQRHLLDAIENNRLKAPIALAWFGLAWNPYGKRLLKFQSFFMNVKAKSLHSTHNIK